MKKCIRVLCVGLIFCSVQGFAGGFTLSSSNMDGQITNEQVFNGFGCTGENISPALSWKNAPEGTKSFALTVYDPDAPTGSGWWHWQVINIPAAVNKLVKNAGNPEKNLMPKGAVQIVTDYGVEGFGGACPPKGDAPHRYIFTVYALKTEKLDLGSDTPSAIVGYNLNANAIAKASIMSYFGR